ncbi:MAG: hypothetical protein JWR32_4857 [Mycobacterium sp.]|nr:hypothetical protein [Mycobacterium sp.]
MSFYDRSRNNGAVWHDSRACGNATYPRASRARKRQGELSAKQRPPARRKALTLRLLAVVTQVQIGSGLSYLIVSNNCYELAHERLLGASTQLQSFDRTGEGRLDMAGGVVGEDFGVAAFDGVEDLLGHPCGSFLGASMCPTMSASVKLRCTPVTSVCCCSSSIRRELVADQNSRRPRHGSAVLAATNCR